MPGLFDNIQLPEEDKDKTAEIPNEDEDPSKVDAPDSTKQAADDKNADNPNTDKDKPDPTKADDKDNQSSDQPVVAADADKDKDKAPGKDTPFHEHPDWIKREQALKEKELEVAKLQGQIEVLEKKATPEAERETKKVERQRAAVVAEQKVVEKINAGWKPKDVLEQQRVYSEFFEEELDARSQAKLEEQEKQQKEFNDTRDRIAAEVATIYKDSGVSSDADKKQAEELALKWAKDGTANWSTKTLQLAIEHLKLEGKIGKPATPAPVPVKDDKDKDKDNKDDVNKKLARNKNKENDPTNGAKKSYKNLVKKSLDDIVSEQQEALG